MKKAIQKLRLHVSFYMRKFPFILLILLIVQCTSNSHVHRALDSAYQLMNHHPDSALAILDSLEPSSRNFSQENLRQWQLLRLMAQNKSDTVFRSDSLQHVLVDYYDQHGTPNEKMWAHYLLGRAYFDMGEALPALEQYQIAASAADTTSTDCDYWNLTRVKLQEVLILYHQNLPDELLNTLKTAEQTAIKARDTISTVLCYEKKAMAYELKGKKDSMAISGLIASVGYRNIGQPMMSARSLYWVIPFNIENGDFNMARQNLETYERESGFFNEKNEIREEKKHYYSLKGRYYLGVDNLDSAEICFRKCLGTQKAVEHEVESSYYINLRLASKGLASLYEKLGCYDSVAKYARLSEVYNDSIYKCSYMSDAMRMERMFNYSKHVRNEKELGHNLSIFTSKFNILIIVLVLFSLLALVFAAKWNLEKRQYKAEIERLRHQKDIIDAIKELENRIAKSKSSALELDGNPIEACVSQMDKNILQSDIYKKIINCTMSIRKGDVTMTNDDWKEFERVFDHDNPLFKTVIGSKLNGSVMEYRICMLAKLGLSAASINKIIGNEYKNMTVLKKRLYKKITDKDGAAQDFDLLIKTIC